MFLVWNNAVIFCRIALDIDECNSKICTNGTCHNTAGSFSCVCSAGYIGRGCGIFLGASTGASVRPTDVHNTYTLSNTLVSYIVLSVALLAFVLCMIMVLYSRHLKRNSRKLENSGDAGDSQTNAEHMTGILNGDVHRRELGCLSNAIPLAEFEPNSPVISSQRATGSTLSCSMTFNAAYQFCEERPPPILCNDLQAQLAAATSPESDSSHYMTSSDACANPGHRKDSCTVPAL